MKTYKRTLILLPLITVFLFSSARSQTNGVDNTYAPAITSSAAAASGSESVQPDGKLIVLGNFIVVNGSIRPTLVRLNTDGSVDPSFTCTVCDFGITSTMVQPDGKVLVAGWVEIPASINGQSRLIRLNADGSLDTSFATNGLATFNDRYAPRLRAIQPDGKIYLTTNFTVPATIDRITLFRLNPDGSGDAGYASLSVSFRPFDGGTIGGVAALPDGRVFVYGNTPYGQLAKLNPDGTKDTTFNGPSLIVLPTIPGNTPRVESMGIQSDNKIVFTGNFSRVNGINKSTVARINADGSLDSSYTPSPAFTGSANSVVKVLSGDRTMFIRNDNPKKVMVNNPDGSVDNTYSAPDALTTVSRWTCLPDGKLLIYGVLNGSGVSQYISLNTDGSLDPTFVTPAFGREGTVRKVTVQPDGKSLIWGQFVRVNGTPRRGLARLNADGSLDPSFDPGTALPSGDVRAMTVQSDGKVLIGGEFPSFNGTIQPDLVRLNSDGSIDSTFTPAITGDDPAYVEAVEIRTDGKILIGGRFSSVNSSTRTSIALLNSNGSLDGAFNPTIGSPIIYDLLAQADGKIMVGGIFSSVNGSNRINLARLNSDGTLDGSFNAGEIWGTSIVYRLSNGKYLIKSIDIRRINADGTPDNTFTPLTSPSATNINAVLPLADGSILIGGTFDTVNSVPRKNIARLSENGTLVLSFEPQTISSSVYALVAQLDGKVIVGGAFLNVGSVTRTGIARLLTPPLALRTEFDFDGDGKADPSVTRPSDFVWHQLSTAGGYTYTAKTFGEPGDKVTPGDYDGDGKADLAIWRPSTGDWWWWSSVTGIVSTRHLGASGDTPMPSDTDGDGKTDLVVVTPNGIWKGMNTDGVIIVWYQFSQAVDKPVTGDFDGDGKSDLAYFRPSNGTWYYNKSSSGANLEVGTVQWGISSDIPVAGDYDGDGTTDVAVFRPSEGNWYVLKSAGGYIMLHFGATGDKPIAADYDGDGKTDIAVYRPSEGFWYELLSTGGYTGYPWGNSTDIPTPNALLVP